MFLEGTVPPILPACMMPPMSPVYPAFSTGPTFYMPPSALIRRPDDVLSSPLRQHILNYEPSQGFVIPNFATFDGSTDLYDHMLHYNQVRILNSSNDWLLCKEFSASLWGPALACFTRSRVIP